MSRVFISYRSADSGYAVDTLWELLIPYLSAGEVFRDAGAIQAGEDFPDRIQKELQSCVVLIAVIGPRWLDLPPASSKADNARAIDDPKDWVRTELRTALERGIRVIPVYLENVPRLVEEDLPPELQALASKQGVDLRRQPAFHEDAYALTCDLRKELSSADGMGTSPHMPESATEFALISAGSYQMGSSLGNNDEEPVHTVEITQGFLMGVTPVTYEEYWRIADANQNHKKDRLQADVRRPIGEVSWYDAIDYCIALSLIEDIEPYYWRDGNRVEIRGGSGYRLPTEAEWEYACRAGTSSRWYFGDEGDDLARHAWYGAQMTRRVGEFKANEWGLKDLYGNVLEWCWDWYDDKYYGRSNTMDPQGPSSGYQRVLRGGSFAAHPDVANSAFRERLAPSSSEPDNGFRIVRNL